MTFKITKIVKFNFKLIIWQRSPSWPGATVNFLGEYTEYLPHCVRNLSSYDKNSVICDYSMKSFFLGLKSFVPCINANII